MKYRDGSRKTIYESLMGHTKIVDLDSCWEWVGVNHNGYGRMVKDGKKYLAHRISYALFNGELLKGRVVHHECENKGCVNPAHLKQVSNWENSVLFSNKGVGFKHKQTHCKRGHKFTKENTYLVKNGKNRNCKKCCLMLAKINYERRKLCTS